MIQAQSPFSQFFDLSGTPLDNGYIYIGQPNLNPETSPITAYWDEAGTLPAAQPIRTSGGYPSRNGAPARIFTNALDYSMTVRDKNSALVSYSASVSSYFGGIGIQVVNTYATLRTIAPASNRRIRLGYGADPGDGAEGDFYGVTGAAPGTYVDNGGTIIVPSGGDGSAAWLRDIDGHTIYVRWFGNPTGSDDTSIIDAAIAESFRLAIYPRSASLPVGPDVHLGDDTVWMYDGRIEIKHAFRLIGNCDGTDNGGSGIQFIGTGDAGITINRTNTLNGGTIAATTGADGAGIDGVYLKNVNGTSGSGIWLRARATIDRVLIENFKEHGIQVVASQGAGGAAEGNANSFSIGSHGLVRVINCTLDGLFIDGADANAGNVANFDGTSNDRWGVYDSSFLGNTYHGCHVAANGFKKTVTNITQANPAVVTATAHGFSTGFTVMITDVVGMTEINGTQTTITVIDANSFSLDGVDSTAYTAYSSGGFANYGGAYKTDNPSARNVFLGCYSEPGQPASQIVTPSIVVSGHHGAGFASNTTAAYLATDLGQFSVNTGVQSKVTSSGVTLVSRNGGNFSNGDILYTSHTTHAPTAWRLKYYTTGDLYFLYADNLGNTPYTITGPNTSFAFGRSAAVPYALLSNKLFVGNGANARNVTTGTTAPATGAWGKGDVVFNINATPGAFTGWQCTVAGTPGTWVPFAPLSTTVTVAGLPTPGATNTNSRMFVSDANATAFGTIVVGGGANYVPVYCDGTNWRIG